MATSINLDIANRVDITTRRGDTFTLELTFNDEEGDPIDLSDGYEWMMQVREADTSTSALLDGDSNDDNANDFGFTGDNNGVLTITASASTMAGIEGGLYVYDLQSSQGAVVTTWMYGIFKINEDVSE
jgi:hypothetical protein